MSPSFDSLLDATLTARDAAPARFARPPLRWLPDPGLQLLLANGGAVGPRPSALVLQNPGRATDNGAPVRVLQAASAEPSRRSSPPHLSRQLSPADRQALALLQASGARELHDGFTPIELRRAWRRIARRSHPDVVAAATASGTAGVNRTFAALAGAYAHLRHVARGPAEAGPHV